jgi:hypothetical protein
VSARAVDGKATEAGLTAVADSFGVRRSAVRLVSGTLDSGVLAESARRRKFGYMVAPCFGVDGRRIELHC